MALAGVGLSEQAASEFEIAMQIRPNDWELHNNLGMALANLGQCDRAIVEFQTAERLNDRVAQVHSNLGSALASRRQFDEAMRQFERALELDPNLTEVHYNLAITLATLGRFDEAIARYRTALGIDAGSVKSLKQLARLLATCPIDSLRNGPEAVRLAEQAVVVTQGRDPVAFDILAAAYAESSRFSEAIQTAKRAVELARQLNEPAIAESAARKLQLYEAGKPFHESLPSQP
jgi:Flp pilus assembly protein TadD